MMRRIERKIGAFNCYLYGWEEEAPCSESAAVPLLIRQSAATPLLIQPVDDHDLEVLDSEVAEIERLLQGSAAGAEPCGNAAGCAFRLAAFKVNDWNDDLSPWEAPPAFGKEPFGGGATKTLAYIEEELLPGLVELTDGQSDAADLKQTAAPVILGGNSLAGLFALWAGTQAERFLGIAAASPSVWFPRWIEHAEEHWQGVGAAGFPRRIYLSLGNKEEKTRNPVMARVGDCIRQQQEILTAAGVENTLVWEQGNHFREPDLRTARAFAWVLKGLRAAAK